MEYSKEFVTSVMVGKDVVPRIGLHQLEALRHDLIQALHKSERPKVRKQNEFCKFARRFSRSPNFETSIVKAATSLGASERNDS